MTTINVLDTCTLTHTHTHDLFLEKSNRTSVYLLSTPDDVMMIHDGVMKNVAVIRDEIQKYHERDDAADVDVEHNTDLQVNCFQNEVGGEVHISPLVSNLDPTV